VGPIIGKKGAFVKYIKEKSNVRLFVENKTESPEDKYKMCTLVGEYSFLICLYVWLIKIFLNCS